VVWGPQVIALLLPRKRKDGRAGSASFKPEEVTHVGRCIPKLVRREILEWQEGRMDPWSEWEGTSDAVVSGLGSFFN
jgi:hypothetical protein